MNWMVIVPGYFLWHYTTAFQNIAHVWMNLLWFITRVFSIPLLLRTLFAPYKRILEEGTGRFDIERWAENLVVNIMSRVVGAMIRIPIIVLGVFALVSTFIFGILLYAFWVFAPLIILGLFITGVMQLV